MTIFYNEHQLRAMASKMRAEIGGVEMPCELKKKFDDLVGLIDGAADGSVSQETLQDAVDKINFDLERDDARRREMEDVSLLVDLALEQDNPIAWRSAMLRWLPLLPDDYLRVLMNNYGDLIDEAEILQAIDLVEMPAATGVHQ
jgi:hypothetical protein